MAKTSMDSTLFFVFAMKKILHNDLVLISIWHVYVNRSLLLKKMHHEAYIKLVVAGQ